MSRKALNLIKVAVGLLLLVFIGPLIYMILMIFVFDARQPVQHFIPNGYVGWIRIEYEVKNAPPLPQRGGYWIAKIPSTGVLRTSSIKDRGWGADEYYYLTAAGSRQKLVVESPTRVGIVHPDGSGRKLFIGTKAQLQKFGWSYANRPGAIKER